MEMYTLEQFCYKYNVHAPTIVNEIGLVFDTVFNVQVPYTKELYATFCMLTLRAINQLVVGHTFIIENDAVVEVKQTIS